MKQSQRIVKNAVFGVGGSVIGGVLYLATTLIIARAVSVREFGEYSFVFAFAMFVSNVADSGLPRMLIREVAKDREGFTRVAGATFSLIWVISAAMCLLVCLIVPFLHFDFDVKISIVVMSVATMSTFHAAGYGAVLRAFEDNELNHLGFVLHKLFLLGLVYLSIKLQYGVLGFVIAHFIANTLLWNFYHLMVSRFYTHVPLRVDVPLWKTLIASALPLGSGVMLRQLALQLDILVLTWLSNLTTVGLFSGPYRISMALRIIPQTLSLPLFPLYSRTAHFSPNRFTEVYQLSIKFFLLISIPIAAFFCTWSEPILRMALGAKYLAAIPAMQLLGIGLIPFFLSTLFQYLFAALDEQKRFFITVCIGSTVRLVLLFILIPLYGFIGPCIAFVCAETFIVTVWIVQLARLGHPAGIGEIIWRPVIAGLAMCSVLFLIHPPAIVARIGVAAVALIVYTAVLFLSKAFSTEELHHAREGLGFISPFVESWTKKLKRNT